MDFAVSTLMFGDSTLMVKGEVSLELEPPGVGGDIGVEFFHFAV